MNTPDTHQLALELLRECNVTSSCITLSVVERAIEKGYTLATDECTKELKELLKQIREQR